MRLFYLICVTLFVFVNLSAHDRLELNTTVDSVNLSKYADVLFTDRVDLPYERISSAQYNTRFTPVKSESVSAGYHKGAVWLRFSLYNASKEPFEGTIELPTPWINYIDVYIKRELQTTTIHTGASRPLSQRDVTSKSYYIPLRIDPSQSVDVYMKFYGQDALTIAPYLYSKAYAQKEKFYSNLYVGALVGIFAVIIAYYLILGISLKESEYLLYAFYIVSLLFFMGTYYGYNLQLFWPEYPHWNQKMVAVSVALTFYSGLLFARHFLNTRVHMPQFDIFLRSLMYLFLALVFLRFLVDDHFLIIRMIVFLVPFYSLGLLYASFRLWQKGVPGNGLFVLAWLLSMVSAFLASVMVQGYVDYRPEYYYFYGIATVIDIILLAFALAAKINTIKRHKEEANHALLQKEKELAELYANKNRELEKIVSERTGKLLEMNKKLRTLATTDKLTGLYNRARFDEALKEEIDNASKDHGKFGVIMIDIDYFKAFNDQFGHQAGDTILSEFADVLKLAVVEKGILSRWGGEEFIVLVHNAELNETKRVAEEIRKKIEAFSFSYAGDVSASFGVTVFKEGDTISRILKRADKALYQAKHSGRNCVRVQ